MSKRFYVLYTLKEFTAPRIYKTKGTVKKYMEENKKLEFEQFSNEKEAEEFTKKIEVKLEKKFGLRFYNEKIVEEKLDRIIKAKKEKGGKKVERDSEDGVEEKDSEDSKNEEIKKKSS